MAVSNYSITLEKSLYFPNEIVRGQVHVQTSQPINCRGVRIMFEGRSYCHWSTGSGDNRKDYYGSKTYMRYKRTVWGQLYTTPVLDNAGENALFGPPWAPSEGTLFVQMDRYETDCVVRVMDYDWGKKDDLLGEISVNVDRVVGRGVLDFQLNRQGRLEKGTVRASFDWDPSSVVSGKDKCLRIVIVGAFGLRKADLFGKNDVYVQAYVLPAGSEIVLERALPEPEKALTLPGPITMDIPFSFQLPPDLPSSFGGSKDAYIAYSVYSNIDVAWKKDPCTRVFFTVVQPLPAAMYPSIAMGSVHDPIHPRCMIPPICCFSFPLVCFTSGLLEFTASTDRSGYAPGETIVVTIKTESLTSEHFEPVSIKQNVTLTADTGATTSYSLELGTVPVTEACQSGSGHWTVRLVVPNAPPTFQGNLGYETGEWEAAMGAGAILRMKNYSREPVQWSYTIDVHAKVPDSCQPCLATNRHVSLPITMCGLGIPVPVIPVAQAIDAPPPYWMHNAYLQQQLPTAAAMAVARPSYSPVCIIRDAEYDCTAQDASLQYQPNYLSWASVSNGAAYGTSYGMPADKYQEEEMLR
jgi:hypothetical protein